MFTQRGERRREASVSHVNQRHEFISAVVLVVACAFSTSCTAWHRMSLQPQRFSADTSPERVRLTFRDSTQLTATHPVIAGDSLVWANVSGKPPRDTARSAVLISSIQRAEVHEFDNPRTIALLVFVAGLVGGLVVLGHAIAAGIDN
jgi:hypothetical protein